MRPWWVFVFIGVGVAAVMIEKVFF